MFSTILYAYFKDGDKRSDVIQYDLLSTVTHIRDPKTGGNLVSHIKGMEVYHQRKEKVTCLQWYLFNDFSITPIEQVIHSPCTVQLGLI